MILIEKYSNKVSYLIKSFVNDKNPLKRGFHRIGVVIGIALSTTVLLIQFFMAACGAFSYYDAKSLILMILMPMLFLFIPIIIAKGIGWIFEGFQNTSKKT